MTLIRTNVVDQKNTYSHGTTLFNVYLYDSQIGKVNSTTHIIYKCIIYVGMSTSMCISVKYKHVWVCNPAYIIRGYAHVEYAHVQYAYNVRRIAHTFYARAYPCQIYVGVRMSNIRMLCMGLPIKNISETCSNITRKSRDIAKIKLFFVRSFIRQILIKKNNFFLAKK